MARLHGALVLLALLGLAAPAQSQTELRWKFKKGQTFYTKTETRQKQGMEFKAPNQNQAQKMDVETAMTGVDRYTVLEAAGDHYVLQKTTESMKVELRAQPAMQNNVTSQLKKISEKLRGATVKLTLTPSGKITHVEGQDDLLKRLNKEVDPATGQFLQTFLTRENLQKGLQATFGFLPEKAVNPGDKWESSSDLSLGPMGSFKVSQGFTYDGKVDGLEQITIKTTMKYEPPTKAAANMPALTGDFKTVSDLGRITFDGTAGKLVRSDTRTQMEGKMGMKAGGQDVSMNMEMEQKVVVALTEKRPTE